jgi:hypothetical protein
MKLALAFIALAAPANAGNLCSTAETVHRDLGAKYGEQIAGFGDIMESTSRFRLYVDPVDGSWSAVVIGADGMACIKAAGEGWVDLPLPPNG